MIILGIHTGHDASACVFNDQKLVAFCKEERLTRKKNDGKYFNLACIDEVLEISGVKRDDVDAVALTRMKLPAECYKQLVRPINDRWKKLLGKKVEHNLAKQMIDLKVTDEKQIVNTSKLKKELGVSEKAEIRFVNHHFSHILGSFFFTDWPDSALYISFDGGGDGEQYSAYYYDGKKLNCILGNDSFFQDPNFQPDGLLIGCAYGLVTELLGFKMNQHEGKITGLAAYGEPVYADQIRSLFTINPDTAKVTSPFFELKNLKDKLQSLADQTSKENMAASIQIATETLILDWVLLLLQKYPAKYIAMSGGIFSNVRLNQCIAELDRIQEVFVFPAMTDEGLSVGNCVQVLLDKQDVKALKKEKMTHVYLARRFHDNLLLNESRKAGFKVEELEHQALSKRCAKKLADNEIGAIFTQRMEMGPRALGARSILASPAARELNDSLNERLERTEFMPFAPYVLDVDADKVFELNECNRQATRFMTITTAVKEEYRSVIPAVVHVDGTARPQIIERELNPLYYDILHEFKTQTGIPCLVNTSFNAHEEPIINSPTEALQALMDNRIDFLICDSAIITK